MTPLFRLIEVVELITLTTCGAYLLEGYKHLLPKTMQIVGRCYVLALLIVAIAVSVNAFAQADLTPGLVVAAVLLFVPAAVVTWYTWHAARGGTFRAGRPKVGH